MDQNLFSHIILEKPACIKKPQYQVFLADFWAHTRVFIALTKIVG
jgi:hypothetical protein